MVKVALFHAALDTGNLGVSALGYSVIAGLARRIEGLSLTVADSGYGVRPDTLLVDNRPFAFKRCGVRLSWKLYRPEALWNLRTAFKFGGGWNPVARHLLKQDFILDITGGDSFTDLYGPKRFALSTHTKTLFLNCGIPLGLLPQTYGPFQDAGRRAIAADIIQRAQFAWARDQRSYAVLQDLLGSHFDPTRHRAGVDVAFLLDPMKPEENRITSQISGWLTNPTKPTVGFNVSGLIFNDPNAAKHQYSFVADYRAVVIDFLLRMLEQSDANILLIPHVVVAPGHVESDITACEEVLRALGPAAKDRVVVVPAFSDPRHVKWVISKCNWFCGTRMHATIAGLSTGVPTAAIAYSLKTAGVFETCGQGEHVADPRELQTNAVVDRLWNSWQQRESARQTLAVALRPVLEQANKQMDEIAAACQAHGAKTLVAGASS